MKTQAFSVVYQSAAIVELRQSLGRGQADFEATIVEAENFAAVEGMLAKRCPGAAAFSISPVEPFDTAWVELRRRGIWYVSERGLSGFRRVTTYDCLHAARLLGEECFGAMVLCNALAGDRTVPWALIHAGFNPEGLLALGQSLMAEVKPLAIKAAVELRRYADDKTARRFGAENALRVLHHRLDDVVGAIPGTPGRPREDNYEDTLSIEALTDSHAVSYVENDDVREQYKRPHNPAWLRGLATKWDAWAAK